MKRISGDALIAISLLVVCNPCFSKQPHTLPNTEATQNYPGKPADAVSTQAASLSHESDAKHYFTLLKNKVHSLVMRLHKQRDDTADTNPLQPLIHVAAIQTTNAVMPIPAKQNVKPPIPAITHHHKIIKIVTPAKIVAADPLPAKPAPQTGWFSHTGSPGFFLSAGGGEQFYRISGNNYLNTGAGWPVDRYVTDSISNQPFFFMACGFTFARTNDWLPYYSLGLTYTYAKTATVSGYIDQYSLPNFRNYNFQYNVQLMDVLAMLKADIYRWQNVMPYLSVGLGAVNYSATNYNEQALDGVTPRVNPAFASNAGINFSASFGAGVDYILRKDLWLNLEFNYTNYGKINTGNGANYTTDTGTNYSNESLGNSIFSTAILIGATYYPE